MREGGKIVGGELWEGGKIGGGEIRLNRWRAGKERKGGRENYKKIGERTGGSFQERSTGENAISISFRKEALDILGFLGESEGG